MKYSEMSLLNIFNVLSGKYHHYTINKKKLKLNKDTNLLIYITGHGYNFY